MKANATRTINPLPFQDLEPHRFEDLVRQLAYELRRWKSVEAIGRSGSDDGIDIRAIELVPVEDEPLDEEGDEPSYRERLWTFQCKRERELGPKRLRQVVEESLCSFPAPPHGFVLAVACDVSKDGRDSFRDEMAARGIGEFYLWAKGELEDMLFQPKNDRLLFAYFGLALQPRRRSLSTTLRSEMTKKKQLTALIDEEQHDGTLMLLRDPSDERYPRQPNDGEPPARWLLCRALTLRKPGHLVVLAHEYLAALTHDRTQWDALFDHDVMKLMAQGELQSKHAWSVDDRRARREHSPHDFWNEYIDDANRVYLKVRRAVPLERVLALDALGDGPFPIPHILVEFTDTAGPFTPDQYPSLEFVGSLRGGHIDLAPEKSNRAQIFPKPLPGLDDPPPVEFDDTSKEAAALSAASEEKLRSLLTKARDREAKAKASSAPEATMARSEQVQAKMKEFLDWRENVAQLVFSSFVHQLRSDGHQARVVSRSRDHSSEPPYSEATASIALRVRLSSGTHYNPRGHISVSIQGNLVGWRTDVSPSLDESRGRYAPAAAVTNFSAVTTKDQLEARVIAMLEQLETKFM